MGRSVGDPGSGNSGRLAGEMKGPKTGGEEVETVVTKGFVVAINPGGGPTAFSSADDVFHADTQGRDEAVPRSVRRGERMVFGSFVRPAEARMLGSLKSRVGQNAQMGRDALGDAVAAATRWSWRAPRWHRSQQADAPGRLEHHHGLARVGLLLAGVLLAVGGRTAGAGDAPFQTVYQHFTHAGKRGGKLGQGMDFAFGQDQFALQHLLQHGQQPVNPSAALAARQIENTLITSKVG